MLELLILSCVVTTIGLVRSTRSGNLLHRLITAKLLCTGLILMGMTVTLSAAPDITGLVIQSLTIIFAVTLSFAALLTLRYYYSRRTVETDEMTF